MRQNVAGQVIGAQMVSATDGSAFTGSVTVYVTINGGTQALGTVGSGAATHEGQGFHTYAPSQAETNGSHVAFTFVGTGAVPATVQVYTDFPQTGDSFARIGANGAGLSAVPWNAAWDAEVQSEVNDALVALHLDHIFAATYDPASKPGAADALFNELVENDGGVSRFSANALEQAPGGGGASNPSLLQTTTIATLASQTSFTLTAGSADNDAYAGSVVVFTDQSTSTQKAVGVITDYVGSTRTVTLLAAPSFTIATGDTVDILAGVNALAVSGAVPETAADIALAVRDQAISGASAGSIGERLGRLPNAAAGGSGGLPTVDANNRIAGIQGTINTLDTLDTNQDAQHTITQGRLPASLVGGRMDASVGAMASGVVTAAAIASDALTAAKVAADVGAEIAAAVRTELTTELGRLDAAITTRATPAEVLTQAAAALVAIHLDHLFDAAYDPASKPGNAAGLLNVIVENDAGVPRLTSNALENAPTGSGGSADWTTGEREQIRHRLGIDGDADAPSASPSLALATAVSAVATALGDVPTNSELAAALVSAGDDLVEALATAALAGTAGVNETITIGKPGGGTAVRNVTRAPATNPISATEVP